MINKASFRIILSVFFLNLYSIKIKASAPVPSAVPANRVTYTGANLNAMVNPGNETTTISFEYGLTTSYGSTASIAGTSAGSTTLFKRAAITGLTPGKTYHYRVKAVNGSGTVYGTDRQFITGSSSSKSFKGQHSIYVGSDGIVYATGPNNYGQLGDSSTVLKAVPIKVLKGAYSGTTYLGDNTNNPIISVAAGYTHSIALAADGTIYTFGDNTYGGLGDSSTTNRYTPVKVLKGAYTGTNYLGDNTNNPVIAIAAGSYHSMTLAADGTLYTFGYNGAGGLGDNTNSHRNTPVKVLEGAYSGNTYLGDNANNPIISIAAGNHFSTALAADGLLYAFGQNNWGQLGDNTTTDRELPVQVVKGAYSGTTYLGDSNSNPIISIAAGYNHSLALAADGILYAYGNNSYGCLGVGSVSAKLTPVKVLIGAYSGTTYLGDNTSNPIIAMAAGTDHSIALAADGTLHSFGWNAVYGQLGDNTFNDKSTPVKVLKGAYSGSSYLGDNASNPIISVAASEDHNIAIAADGTIYAFGYNNGGLGDSTTTNRKTAVKVVGVGGTGVLDLIVTASVVVTNNWANKNTWGGAVPVSSTNVIVDKNIYISGYATCNNITINLGDTLFVGSGGSLTINGKLVINGYLKMTAGTIILNSCDTIPSATYWQLKLAANCNYTLGGNVICMNNFLIPNTGTSLNLNGYILNVKRDVTHYGTMTGLGKLLLDHPTATQTLAGTGTYANLELNTSAGARMLNSATISDTLFLTAGSFVIYTGTTCTIGSTSTSNGNIITTGGNILSSASSTANLQILGNASAPEIANLKITLNGILTLNRPNGIKLGAHTNIGASMILLNSRMSMNGYNLSVGKITSSNLNIICTNCLISNTGNTGTLSLLGNPAASFVSGLMMDTMFNFILNSNNGASIGSNVYIKNSLQLTKGKLDLNSNHIKLSTTANLNEAAGQVLMGSGSIYTIRKYAGALSNNNIAGLGLILSTNNNPDTLTVTRKHNIYTGSTGSSIKRNYNVSASSRTGLVANTFSFNYDSSELNMANRSYLKLNKSNNVGSTWSTINPYAKTTANTPIGYVLATNVNLADTNNLFTLSDSASSPLIPAQSILANIITEQYSVRAWPVPFSNTLNIEVEGNARIGIYDMNGRLVLNTTIIGRNSLNTESLQPDLYILRIENNNEVKICKIVKL